MTIDLQRFCATETEGRYYMRRPFRNGDFICATNGHVAIAIPDDGREMNTRGNPPKMPDVLKLLDRPILGEFAAMPALASVKECGACERCGGQGKHRVVLCEECHGSGEIEHGKHSYTCEECSGEGSVGSEDIETVCLACEGFGERGSHPAAHRSVIGKAGFQTRYLRAFSALPGCEIAVGGPNDMAHIRFEGGRGAVMPMKG